MSKWVAESYSMWFEQFTRKRETCNMILHDVHTRARWKRGELLSMTTRDNRLSQIHLFCSALIHLFLFCSSCNIWSELSVATEHQDRLPQRREVHKWDNDQNLLLSCASTNKTSIYHLLTTQSAAPCWFLRNHPQKNKTTHLPFQSAPPAQQWPGTIPGAAECVTDPPPDGHTSRIISSR